MSKGVVVQLVRIPALQAGGRGFEYHHLHKIKEFGVEVVTLEFGSKGGGSIPSIPTKTKRIGGLSTPTDKGKPKALPHFDFRHY